MEDPVKEYGGNFPVIYEKGGLISILKRYNIPLVEWGKNNAKTIDHLLEELNSGETFLTEDGGRIIRESAGVALNVYYREGGECLYLKESRQIFNDGRTRVRNLNTSIGEKVKPKEDLQHAARRALEEELQITDGLSLTPLPTELRPPVASVSYPGIFSKCTIHKFEVFLAPHLYKPEGYKEVQKDKINYFEWVSIDQGVIL